MPKLKSPPCAWPQCSKESVDRISVSAGGVTCKHCGAEQAAFRYADVCSVHLDAYTADPAAEATNLLLAAKEA